VRINGENMVLTVFQLISSVSEHKELTLLCRMSLLWCDLLQFLAQNL